MPGWTIASLATAVHDFSSLNNEQQFEVLTTLNTSFPPSVFALHRNRRSNALSQANRIKKLLETGSQGFPSFVTTASLSPSAEAMKGCAIVFTAGGEGERLRLGLEKQGVAKAALHDFTKATYGLPGFPPGIGSLHINLLMVAHLCATTGIDIPVVVTTGPSGSITSRVIPAIAREHSNFGLKHLRILEQEERLFLTNEERIVLQQSDNGFKPVTHPDETGGPIMKLKTVDTATGTSTLDWMEQLGCTKTIVVQATALYDRSLIPSMAVALSGHDCLGVGILRATFPASDPYGTYVAVTLNGEKSLQIIEQDIRNDTTRTLTDPSGRWRLPFNTGFYAFENRVLTRNSLPDFATPPKELRPDLPRSPKIGYAATDLIALADNPIILAIDASMFGVLKNADDLDRLSELGKKFGLDKLYTASS